MSPQSLSTLLQTLHGELSLQALQGYSSPAGRTLARAAIVCHYHSSTSETVRERIQFKILSHPANINDRLPCRPPAIGDCRNRMNARSQAIYTMARWLPALLVRNILISESRRSLMNMSPCLCVHESPECAIC